MRLKNYSLKEKILIGRKIDSIELFPASEGLYAFQDKQESKELLLILNDGIFYEFIEQKKFHSNIFDRISIAEVCLNTNYVLIVSTTAGLWAYNTGDTIKFTSLKPYRVIVTGRVAQVLSACGEHVIVKEVEQAVEEACVKTGETVNEFTVAPKLKNGNEFKSKPTEAKGDPENPLLMREIKDKFEDLVGALSFPISKNLNKNFTALIVPGITFLPEKLGSKGIGKNAYGNNFYIGSGIVFDVTEDLNLLLSYTTPLGPGNNCLLYTSDAADE